MEFKAVILDLDGVVTQTASLHAAAWKRLFDAYSAERSAKGKGLYQPFDPQRDYLVYVDGRPRQDGVHAFLFSRGIDLPIGDPADPPDRETCHGLGNRKDAYFKELLQQKGPVVFDDAVTAIQDWRSRGLKTAIASSSKNCEQILRLAGLTQCFDARVDGTHLEKWKMPGKPAPDMFLAAARALGIQPREAVLFEDAISGVEAGRRGGFGLVVGVDRHGSPDPLVRAGANQVVNKLTEVAVEAAAAPEAGTEVAGEAPGLRTQVTAQARDEPSAPRPEKVDSRKP